MSQKRLGQRVRMRHRANEHNHVVTYYGIGLRDECSTALIHSDPFPANLSKRVAIRDKRRKRVKKGRVDVNVTHRQKPRKRDQNRLSNHEATMFHAQEATVS